MNIILTSPKKYRYFVLLLSHILLGLAIYWNPFLAKIYGLAIVFLGLYLVIKTKNSNHQVLLAAAYITGVEVLLRSTSGALNYEFAKYAVTGFALLGLIYSGFSRKALLYFLYLLLLIPGIVIANDVFNLQKADLKVIIFDISGPVCLGIISMYGLGKKISYKTLNRILLAVGLPILTTCIYVYANSPEVSTIVGVESNRNFSGRFGPNQVATTLGLGLFIFFTRVILKSKTRGTLAANALICALLFYTGLLTFSRAGIITGLFAAVTVALFIFFYSADFGRSKVKSGLSLFLISVFAISTLVAYQTDGLIVKRYTNRDHLGRMKRPKVGDRESLAKAEVDVFLKNPVLGVGVAQGNKIRERQMGMKFQSHDEVTRMLAEHGMFGFLGMLILIVVPVWLFFSFKQPVYLTAFFVFWFFTINHSGTRIAAPAFFYALMLLRVNFEDAKFFKRRLAGTPVAEKVFAVPTHSA